MLIHPNFDPVALDLGFLKIHWYGLMYVLAYLQALFLGRSLIQKGKAPLNAKQFDDLLFYAFIGIILGGRLGEVLFYAPSYYFSNLAEIFKIWKGGMSFHGGFLGVLFAVSFFVHKNKMAWLQLTDFIAPLVPLGLMFGRLGNFINGELWGRITSSNLPWGMIFPQSGSLLPRHPSQIYHMLLEGALLFCILWFYSQKNTQSAKPVKNGKISALFLIGYGICRFITEFFREPDEGIFGKSYFVSMGQWLSLPMILCGIILFSYCHFQKKSKLTVENDKKL